jgi:two-component system, cell cycle sensor histidine kinase and response regulator CckA
VLESFGYRVLTAANGMEAIETLERSGAPLHMVITDLVMPKVSGRELVEWIATRRPRLPVLLMSGYTDDEIIRTAIEGAEVPYLQKPFSPSVLAKKVRELFDAVVCAA